MSQRRHYSVKAQLTSILPKVKALENSLFFLAPFVVAKLVTTLQQLCFVLGFVLDVFRTGLLLGGDDPVHVAEQLLAIEPALAGVLVLQVRLLLDKQLARFNYLVLL
jgi:hypothetical protein